MAAALLALLVTPLAVTATERGGDARQPAAAAGNERGEPVQIQVRNRSRGETGLVTRSDGFSLRLSNTREGDGGGAVYGCRARPGNEACIYADNLRTGRAFLFRSRQGSVGGRIEVGGPNAVPFETNAGGLVQNLNADKVDGLDAGQLQGQQGPQGPQGVPGPTASAAAETDDNVALPLFDIAEVMQTSITTSFAARILATATVGIDSDGGANDQVVCYLNEGTGDIADDLGQRFTQSIPDSADDRAVMTVAGATSAPVGTHTIRVYCGMNAGSGSFDDGNLILWAAAE